MSATLVHSDVNTVVPDDFPVIERSVNQLIEFVRQKAPLLPSPHKESSADEREFIIVRKICALLWGYRGRVEGVTAKKNDFIRVAIEEKLLRSQNSLQQMTFELVDWDKKEYDLAVDALTKAALPELEILTLSSLLTNLDSDRVLRIILPSLDSNNPKWIVVISYLYKEKEEAKVFPELLAKLEEIPSQTLLHFLPQIGPLTARNALIRRLLSRRDISTWFDQTVAFMMANARTGIRDLNRITKVEAALLEAVVAYLDAVGAVEMLLHPCISVLGKRRLIETHSAFEGLREQMKSS